MVSLEQSKTMAKERQTDDQNSDAHSFKEFMDQKLQIKKKVVCEFIFFFHH